MAKTMKNRKPVSSRSKGLIALILLCALTVFVSCLAIGGMKLDQDGVNILLPWVPVSGSNWPQSLPLNRALGGGNYALYAATAGEGASLEDTAKVISARLAGLGETDHSVTVAGDAIRVETRAMDEERLAGVLAMAVMPGRFEFKDSDGNVLATDKDVTRGTLGYNSSGTAYVATLKLTKDGAKKLEDAGVSTVSVTVDGAASPSYFNTFSGDEISMTFSTSYYSTVSNMLFLLNTGSLEADVNQVARESGVLDASAAGTRTVVVIVGAVMLVAACVYMLVKGKLTGVSGIWTVWCALLLGLFFVATVVVPSTNALNAGCLIAILLGLLLAIYTAVTRTDAISQQIADGASAKAASKLGFRSAAKQIWIVHGCALVLALILMIFSFSRSTGYTLAAFVVASAIAVLLMRVFQMAFNAVTNKPALFGKAK